MAEQNIASAVAFKVKVSGGEIEDNYMVGWIVDQDLGQPDMCSVALRNEDHSFSDKYKLGDPVEVTAGADDAVVFKGELNGMEPTYRANGENIIVLRAFNRLHRLTRARKSKTYVKQSDKDIVGAVAGEHGLSPKVGKDASTKHEHVYQHNQSDLEFLRVRAARLGYEVWVEDKDLYFDRPDPSKDSGIKLRYGDAETSKSESAIFLKRFTPRLSSARVLEEVEVRGWDPVKKEEIVKSVKAKSSKLGKTAAHSATKKAFSNIKSFEVDHPIYSAAEAEKIGESKIREATMSYVTGDGECRGTPKIKPGVVVAITVNPDNQGDRFNGKYMIVGATHKYSNTKVGDTGGYVTAFRVNRDAEGG